MKKILILTAAFGEGHNSAARGIREGLAQVAGRDVQVELHDLFAETYGAANTWARESYLGLINQWPQAWSRVYRWLDRQQKFAPGFKVFFTLKKHFRRLLGSFEPDVIVSVYPAYTHMLDEMLGSGGEHLRQAGSGDYRLTFRQRDLVSMQRGLLTFCRTTAAPRSCTTPASRRTKPEPSDFRSVRNLPKRGAIVRCRPSTTAACSI